MRRSLLAILVLLVAAPPADARWSAAGTGPGTATTATLAAGNQPAATASGRTVTVTFTQTSFRGNPLGGYPNGGYTVRRNGALVTTGTCAGTVSGSGGSLACTETNAPVGNHTYTVEPTLDDSWTGAQSAASGAVAVAPDAPATLTATPALGAQINLSWSAVTDATGYAVYRATTSGGPYTLRASGVSGTTYSDTGTNGITYFYVVRAVALGNESVNSPQATAVADSSPPNAFTVTAPTYLRGTATLSANATDSGSGIDHVTFQALIGATWQDACTAATSPYSCTVDSTTTADGSYQLRAIATDRAGYTTTAPTITRTVDNTAPVTTLTDPGSPLRATVSLANTATDTGGSGITNVKVQRSPTGAGTWTDICSTATAAACSFNTTTVADGTYDLRVLATDAAGNTGSTVVAARVLDNTKPTGTNVQAANKAGGTAGRIEQGDTITFTFSEAMKPSTFLTGWTGASTNVTVRVTTANPGVLTLLSGTTQIPLGSVSLGKQYATVTQLQFNTSPMVMSGSTITVTMGTLAVGGIQATATGTGTLAWTTLATPTDIAGNALTVGTVSETGTADLDF